MTAIRRFNYIRPTRPGGLWRAGVHVDVAGLRDISRVFTPSRIERVLRVNMARIANRATELVPVRTGLLKSTIRLVVTTYGGEITCSVVAGNSLAYYGPYVEFGTAGRTARPFMRPAWDELSEEVRKDIINELRDMVSSVKRRQVR